jgi:hypothetical protein
MILFLRETKMERKRIDRFQWILNVPNLVVRDCKGCSGGLALFWRRGMEVAVKSLSKYHIDALVQEEGGVEWRMTAVYGEQKTKEKGRTWRLFRILNNQRKSMVVPKGF